MSTKYHCKWMHVFRCNRSNQKIDPAHGWLCNRLILSVKKKIFIDRENQFMLFQEHLFQVLLQMKQLTESAGALVSGLWLSIPKCSCKCNRYSELMIMMIDSLGIIECYIFRIINCSIIFHSIFQSCYRRSCSVHPIQPCFIMRMI